MPSEGSTTAVSRWFNCHVCGLEVHDPYAEEHDGMLYGECECGAMLKKEPTTA